MTEKKKDILMIACGGVILLLGALIFITGELFFSAALHIFTRLLCTLAVVWIIRKVFREQVSHNINKVSVLCGAVTALDLVIADGIRHVLSGGESGVLLLPACVPLSFMIVMFYTFKEKRDRLLTAVIGILLLLLSLYFEVCAFMDAYGS